MGKSMAEVLMDKGRKEGRKEGRKVGLEEGRKVGLEEGRREGMKDGDVLYRQNVLLMLLRKRFGDLSAEIVVAVQATRDLKTLDGWLERILTAKTLESIAIPAER